MNAMECGTCKRRSPEARVEAYFGANECTRLCDDCLQAEIPSRPNVTVVFPSGATSDAEHYVRTYRPY
jgi:hypothetical protein